MTNITSQLAVCLVVSLLLSAINFGSATTLQAILSVSNAALIFSYIVSIGSVRLKRLRGLPLLPSRFSLGKWGDIVNDISLAFLLVGFIFSFFPLAPSVGDAAWAADFNCAIVILSGTCVLAGVYYVLGGGERYVAPVSLVKTDDWRFHDATCARERRAII
jgi:choline transport protein